jgi:hypothetical protein
MTANAASHVYFGLNPMWVSTCVLAITYATIMSEKVNRSIVALVGAGVMILTGVLDQDEAIKGILPPFLKCRELIGGESPLGYLDRPLLAQSEQS